ncbi:MAG TPA: sigma-70 family RNA polymerase sigma factor [Polyangia bacterium]
MPIGRSVMPEARPAEKPAGESDEALMLRYQSGDERAFDALYRRHAPRVHGFLVRLTGDRARADDLLQIAWLHVHRARGSFRAGERFTAWLYTIANNARRDEGRRSGRDRAILTADGELPEPASAALAPVSDGPDPERVKAALARLPANYREVIVLHRWHDLGFGEIATIVGASEGAVKLRAHRGYLALRELLVKEAAR